MLNPYDNLPITLNLNLTEYLSLKTELRIYDNKLISYCGEISEILIFAKKFRRTPVLTGAHH